MLEHAAPVLPGDDLALAKDFYVGKLGFTVRVETTEDGKNEIMGLERGTIELTIDRLSHVRTRSQRVRLARCEQRGCLSIFIIGPIVEQGRIDSTDTDEAAARSRESS